VGQGLIRLSDTVEQSSFGYRSAAVIDRPDQLDHRRALGSHYVLPPRFKGQLDL
jgi:hypothetical protein